MTAPAQSLVYKADTNQIMKSFSRRLRLVTFNESLSILSRICSFLFFFVKACVASLRLPVAQWSVHFYLDCKANGVHLREQKYDYSRLSLSRLRLSRITAYLEKKI